MEWAALAKNLDSKLKQNWPGIFPVDFFVRGVGRMDNIFKTIIAVCGAVASFLFGGWSSLLTILLTFVVLDYVTGVVAAFEAEGRIN